MRVFISADIEGTCGIAAWSETEPGKTDGDYNYYRTQMSCEVAAACRAVVACGGEVMVKDAHDSARNLLAEYLPEEARLNRGWSGDLYSMVSGVQSGTWDAVAFTGYHTAAGSAGNALAHTMTTKVDWITINGERASEFLINAYKVGYLGIPVCFISGDADVCAIAKRTIPAIATVPVFEGHGNSSTAIHPALAVRRIEETLRAQLESGNYRNCHIQMPEQFEILIRFKEHQNAYRGSFYPGMEQIEEKTIRFVCTDYADAMRMFKFVL